MSPDDGMKRGNEPMAAERLRGNAGNQPARGGTITVDVEDYFQVGAFARTISRVEGNVSRAAKLLGFSRPTL